MNPLNVHMLYEITTNRENIMLGYRKLAINRDISEDIMTIEYENIYYFGLQRS